MFRNPEDWSGPSADPNDEQFGDIVEPATLEDADDYDAVLVGEPYDGAVIGRRGANEGPAQVKDALASVKTHHFAEGPVASVADLGDVVLVDDDVDIVQEEVFDAAGTVHDTAAMPVFVGGDNSLSYPNAAPLLESGSLGVVSFDAHLDCRDVRGEPTSGTPYRQLFDAGLDSLAVVGARHFETSTRYADYLAEQGGAVVTAERVGDSVDAAIEGAMGALEGVDQLYVSVDIDVLDAAYTGASAPTPGGLQPRELFRLVRDVAGDPRVAGFEVVETAPPLDTDGRTVDAAARTIAHFLAGSHA
jgi:formiminoglutamase